MFESGATRKAGGLTNRKAIYFCHDCGNHANSLVRELSKSRLSAQETGKLLLPELKTRKSGVAFPIQLEYFSKTQDFLSSTN
jgi:hypothetical protein